MSPQTSRLFPHDPERRMRKKERKKTFDRLGGVPEKKKKGIRLTYPREKVDLVNGFEILLLPGKKMKKTIIVAGRSRNIERNNVREIAASKHIVLRKKKKSFPPLELCLLFP